MSGNIVSTFNSTTEPIASGQIWMGIAHDVSRYNSVLGSVLTDQNGTMWMEASVDGVNWDEAAGVPVIANVPAFRRVTITRSHYRCRFENTSSEDQTFLRLQTILGEKEATTSSIDGTISQSADAVVVRSLSEETTIAEGKMDGYSIVTKSGYNPDIDKTLARLPEDIWGGNGVYSGFPDGAAETIEIFSSDDDDSASGSGARQVFISGLNDDWERTVETVILDGTSSVTTVNAYRRLSFMAVTDAASTMTTNAGEITARHSTTTGNVFLKMLRGRNQSNCAGYTVAAGHDAYIVNINGSVQSSRRSNVTGAFWQRNFGDVFRLRRPFVIATDNRLQEQIYGGIKLREKTDLIPRITEASHNNIGILFGYDLKVVERKS